jgi:hypothetical protein
MGSSAQPIEGVAERVDRDVVAFTTCFHILSARDVSDLDAMAKMFGDIINEAEALDLPSDSVTFLRPIEMMMRARCRSVGRAEKELLSAQES